MSWHATSSSSLPFDLEEGGRGVDEYEQTSKILSLNYYIQNLNRRVETLHPEYRRRIPYDAICQLSHSILDGTVFQIVKGLQEVQCLTEKSLSDRRSELVKSQRVNKKLMLKNQETELSMVEKNKFQRNILLKQHEAQKSSFSRNCAKELAKLDEKLVLELDRQVSEQQSALYRAGVPFFRVTSDPSEIRVQMVVLQMIMGLAMAE